MSFMMVQTNKIQIELHWVIPQTQNIQCKEIGNDKYYEETIELEKWQIEISPG